MDIVNRLLEMKNSLIKWGLPVEVFDLLLEDEMRIAREKMCESQQLSISAVPQYVDSNSGAEINETKKAA